MSISGKRTYVFLDPASPVIFGLWLYLIPFRWLLSWLAAVAIHELGHLLFLHLFGGKVVSFQICGTGCKIESTALTFIQQILCIAAGPVVALSTTLFAAVMPRVALCALVHSVFNLLPVYPLDGGRILRLIWKNRKTPCKQASLRVQ